MHYYDFKFNVFSPLIYIFTFSDGIIRISIHDLLVSERISILCIQIENDDA